jgi:ABC-type phosphate transport system substrate-binding protein
MIKKKYFLTIILTFLFIGLFAQEGYKVIVNPSNSLSSLNKTELANLFLKKVSKFSNGTSAQPVDQIESSQTRNSFSNSILKKNVAAVKSYWQQQLFSGAGVPPDEKKSDNDVIEFVKANEGAIGYVSSSANTSGVKVITVQ